MVYADIINLKKKTIKVFEINIASIDMKNSNRIYNYCLMVLLTLKQEKKKLKLKTGLN